MRERERKGEKGRDGGIKLTANGIKNKHFRSRSPTAGDEYLPPAL